LIYSLLQLFNRPYCEVYQRAADGDLVVVGQMTGKLARGLQSVREAPRDEEKDALTPRERESLSHLTKGHSNKTIVSRLDLSPLFPFFPPNWR
jgi:DNA-binding NarL/FixJ family response regulator